MKHYHNNKQYVSVDEIAREFSRIYGKKVLPKHINYICHHYKVGHIQWRGINFFSSIGVLNMRERTPKFSLALNNVIMYGNVYGPKKMDELPRNNVEDDDNMPEADMEKVSKMMIDKYQTEGKIIRISEGQYKRVFNKRIISENSIDRRVNSIISKYANVNDFNKIREIRSEVLKMIPNGRAKNDKYLGAICMYYLKGELTNAEDRFRLNYFLGLIHKGVFRPKNGILAETDFDMASFSEVKERLEWFVPSRNSIESYNLPEKVQKVGNYTIYRIDNFEDTKYVHSILNEANWCIFNDEDTFYAYTEGEVTVYLCVRDDFERVHETTLQELVDRLNKLGMQSVVSEFYEEYDNYIIDGDIDDLAYLLSDVQDDIAEEILCKADYANGLPPSDDYGLSAMVVMVNNSNGNLSSVYSRYNLPNMFDGFIIDYNGLTNILGKDATSVFVPNKQNEE